MILVLLLSLFLWVSLLRWVWLQLFNKEVRIGRLIGWVAFWEEKLLILFNFLPKKLLNIVNNL